MDDETLWLSLATEQSGGLSFEICLLERNV